MLRKVAIIGKNRCLSREHTTEHLQVFRSEEVRLSKPLASDRLIVAFKLLSDAKESGDENRLGNLKVIYMKQIQSLII